MQVKPYTVANMKFSIRELFTLDHALRNHLARNEATQQEINQEMDLLDKINDGIREIRRKRRYGEEGQKAERIQSTVKVSSGERSKRSYHGTVKSSLQQGNGRGKQPRL